MKQCDKCGFVNQNNDVFCLKCGHMIGFGQKQSTNNPGTPRSPKYPSGGGRTIPPPQKPQGSSSSQIIDTINDFIGNDSSEPLKWTDLFTGVFKKHTHHEAEDIFIYGTRRTTPPLFAVSSDWPKPWLYSRVLLGFIVTFFILKICVDLFGSVLSIPGLIVIGSMAFPLAMVVLFLEVNVFRNISFYSVSLIFLVGGGAAIFVTLLLYSLVLPNPEDVGYIEALLISLIEETGKFFIIYFFLKKLPNCRYILNGLLVGAVVGAGFAALESAGYAFVNFEQMYSVIYLRGFLAPGGHIAWSAIVGAALIVCGKARQGQLSLDKVLSTARFWRIILFPIILHFLWDTPFIEGMALGKYILLFVAAWVVTLVLIQMGLREVDIVANRII